MHSRPRPVRGPRRQPARHQARDYREFIKAVADAQAGAITLPQFKARIKAVEDAESKVKANRDMMEKMLREGV